MLSTSLATGHLRPGPGKPWTAWLPPPSIAWPPRPPGTLLGSDLCHRFCTTWHCREHSSASFQGSLQRLL